MFLNYEAVTHSDQPLAAKTGAPGQNNCTQCHSGTVNNGTGSISFTFPESKWTPDSTYNLQVDVIDNGQTDFGFQMTALNESGSKSGNLIRTNNTNTAIQSSGGKQYISHLNANTNSTWNFDWDSPTYSPEDTLVTFYIAANAANSNGSTSGDNIYTTSITVDRIFIEDTTSADTTLSIFTKEKIDINIFPNPSEKLIHIVNKDINISKASIYSTEGRYIKTAVFTTKSDVQTIDINNLSKGQYVLKVYSNFKEYGQIKFVKN